MHAITKLRRIVCFAFHTGVSLLYTFPKNIEMPILAQKFDFVDFGTFCPIFLIPKISYLSPGRALIPKHDFEVQKI